MNDGNCKRQFSKCHVIFADFLVAFVFCVSALLSYLEREPISDVSIAVITAYGAFATGGYFALSGFRDHSKNKHGVTHGELQIPGPHDQTNNSGSAI